MANNGSVSVYIYEHELEFLKWLVLQKRDIETGGDLFGLWQDKHTAVVQLISGPGKGCKRTTTSFHQDVDYLKEVGEYLTSLQGLCNIGEWHSHHKLGLAEPSHGDQNTVWKHLPTVAGGRFIVFIANITGEPARVNIGCFLFDSSLQKMLTGNMKCLPAYSSPVRQKVDMKYHNITSDAEYGQDWKTFKRSHTTDQETQTSNEKFGQDWGTFKRSHTTDQETQTSNEKIGQDWKTFGTESDELRTSVKSTGPVTAADASSSKNKSVCDQNETIEEQYDDRRPLISHSGSGQEETSWIRKLLRLLCCCCCCCCEGSCDDCGCCYCKCHCGCDGRGKKFN
ncbi:uncharacterized protein LOC114525643 [Dendronephthya gigantea]|uniref:uncharacterized protein LOC114525643 n=1 Tax=Dendronephthya gigantea TaxID=151771 RepID=UPI0010691777|nr:uncharacterized protein LOC114525643 [Dendronephthya gigantea]